MIKLFTGDDRVKAKQEIIKLLGEDYEIIDGSDINPNDLPSIFFGSTLFASHRKILIRDLAANKSVFDELPKYLHTHHEVILFETKLDKRSATYKALKDQLEIREFKLPEPDFFQVFNIYKVAKTDGKKAIKMLEDIKPTEDPIKFTGLLISQAIKDFSAHQGAKEEAILKALAAADLQMKTTGTDPWLIVESFLLRLKTL